MTDRTQQIHRRPLTGTQPAAGAGFALTPNTVGHWRIMGLTFRLTTSAAVGNRHVNLALTDGTTQTWLATAAQDQAANLITVYQLYPQATPTNVVAGLMNIQAPPDGIWLPKGWQLTVSATGLDVADQFSAITLDVQEIPDGPDWFAEPSMVLNVVPLDQ